MNGRVYDYNVGRFMSVDPIIQGHGNSQGINPYSYIMNNPLAGTDPTGYEICDDVSCHEQNREVEEPEGSTDDGQSDNSTNNGADNYQSMNENSSQTPVFDTESSVNKQNKEPEKKEESATDKIERIVTTCDKKCQNEAKLQERIVEYTKKALREQQTRWVRGPTGHMQTHQGAVHELIYGPNSQLTDNQCGTFTAMVCAASIFFGGEIPEELSSFRDEFLDGADKATDAADKLKDSLDNKNLKKIPLNKPAKLVKDSLSLGKAWQICQAACDAKNKALY